MNGPMKVIRTDRELECSHIDAGLQKRGVDLVLLPDGIGEDDLAREVADADLLLMCYTPISAKVIEAGKRLRGIVKYGVGIDAIDIEAARDNGVVVVNIPEYAENTVAEGAFCLMMALAKRLLPMDREMKNAGWIWPTRAWLGLDIAGKTVGIIGLGRIGRSMARMAGAGFSARVLGYSPGQSADEMQRAGAEKRDDLRMMLAECDFVSLHCVLNDQTRHIIGEHELRAMKPTAFLINTSRGALVDEAALVRALREGWIAGAGLDVYGQEPLVRTGHPMSELFDLPNVIMLPHFTFFTREAMMRLEEETLERCHELLDGKPVLVKSLDPRLRSQTSGVVFGGP